MIEREAFATEPLPRWATDANTPLPLRYEMRGAKHAMILGDGLEEQRAVALSDVAPGELGEELIGLAAGAWHAVTGQNCDRSMADLIAKGWIKCYARAQN